MPRHIGPTTGTAADSADGEQPAVEREVDPLGPKKPSAARARILDTADRLFSTEGIRVVGVERLVKEADVSRLTFYRQFPSKEELIVAYLTRRSSSEQDQVANSMVEHPDEPRAVMREIVAAMRREFAAPGFRGCPFINAAAEFADPAGPVRQAVAEHRRWYRETMRQLALRIGVEDAEAAADDLVLLRDGAMVSGYLGDAAVAAAALTRAGRTIVARL